MSQYAKRNTIYLKICSDLENRAKALYPLAQITQIFPWAKANHPKRYSQVKDLEAKFEELWADEAPIEEVKNGMLSWARKVLELYKARHEEMSNAQQSLAMGE
jgi:TfoX/Sxy family transcriptional regulator of competence genes